MINIAKKGQLAVIEYLAGIKFDLNAKTSQAETPLLLASRNGKLDVVEFLLNNGADPLINSESNIF